MLLHRFTLAGVLAGAASSAAAAAVTPVSQERYVFQSVGKGSMLESADGFGLFSASFSGASQVSFISPDVASGTGTVGPDPTFGINSATSYFNYVFDVTSSTDFAFLGSLSTGLFGSAAVHFSGPGGDIVNLTISPFDSVTWNESGTLAPGTYTLEVFASNSIGGELSTYEFALLVPAPAPLAALALAGLVPAARRRRR